MSILIKGNIKVFSVLLILTLFLSTSNIIVVANSPSDVVDTNYETAVNVLQALGFINSYADGSFNPSGSMARVEFAVLLANLSALNGISSNQVYFFDVPQNHWAKDAINNICADGIMTGENRLFRPDDALTREEAAQGFVSLLGYGPRAQRETYLSVATSLGLFRGLSNSPQLTRGDIMLMAYNALSVKMILVTDFNANGGFSRATISDHTILSHNFNIYNARGQFTAIDDLDLVRIKNSRENHVRIDDVLYTLPQEGLEVNREFLAYSVEYWYRDNGNGATPVLLYYIVNENNDVLEADAKNIVANKSTMTQIVYLNESDREQRRQISTAARFIVNGQFISDYAKNDSLLDFESGSVKIVSAKNGLNEIVWIWRYEYRFALAAGISEIILQGGETLDMSDDNNDLKPAIYTASRDKTDLNDIHSRSGIAVAEVIAADGVTYRNVFVLRSVSGEISEMDNDYIVISGESYEMLTSVNTAELRLGFLYTFFIGMDGRICLVDSVPAPLFSFGYLLGIGSTMGLSTELQFKIMNTAGDKVVYTADNRVQVNDFSIRYNSPFADDGPICRFLYNKSQGRAIRQVISYIENDEGKITHIYTPSSVEAPHDILTLDLPETSLQCKTSAIFNFGGILTVKDSGFIFAIPNDANNADDDDFDVLDVAYFTNDASYTVAGYNMNELLEADIIVVTLANTDGTTFNEGNTFTCVFDKKSQVLTEDGTIAWSITYWQQGRQFQYTIADRSGRSTYISTLEEIEKLRRGDLFKVELTNDGTQIKNIAIEFQQAERVESATTYNGTRTMFYGRIEAIGTSSLVIRQFVNDSAAGYLGDTRFLYKNAARVNTYVYAGDNSSIEFRPNGLADARVGDWVVYQARYGAARTLMIYRDKTRIPNGKQIQ